MGGETTALCRSGQNRIDTRGSVGFECSGCDIHGVSDDPSRAYSIPRSRRLHVDSYVPSIFCLDCPCVFFFFAALASGNDEVPSTVTRAKYLYMVNSHFVRFGKIQHVSNKVETGKNKNKDKDKN
jgi:hypothetical protein